MNKTDKQILKTVQLIWNDSKVLNNRNSSEYLSQIKQSILKAIMERFNELGKNFTGYAFSKGEIESVIKEILGGKE